MDEFDYFHASTDLHYFDFLFEVSTVSRYIFYRVKLVFFPGLSSFPSEHSNKMLHKNQFLLSPHVPSRDNSKVDSSNSTVNSNETSETSELRAVEPHGTVNHNFLMETHNNEHHIAIINDNDENYFEIFKTPMKFGTENNSEVTAQIGTTAHLPCTIHNVGEGVVSCDAVIFPSNGMMLAAAASVVIRT